MSSNLISMSYNDFFEIINLTVISMIVNLLLYNFNKL